MEELFLEMEIILDNQVVTTVFLRLNYFKLIYY